MNKPTTQITGIGIEGFTQTLPASQLNYPEYHLYHQALEQVQLKDIADNRRLFKQCLTERKVQEGIPLNKVDQQQLKDFMDPGDAVRKPKRASELRKLTKQHLDRQVKFTDASRLAMLQLFHQEAPLAIAEMDKEYFKNPVFVKADLTKALRQAKGNSLADLSTTNPVYDTPVTTQSGETMPWVTYLRRASGVLFGTKGGKKSKNPHRPPDALNALFERCGVVTLNKKYFKNPTFVKADLTNALKQAEGNSLADLNTKNPAPDTPITTQSGQIMTWQTYLNRASGVLFGTKRGKKSDNPHRQADALNALFELCEVITLNEKYFKNPTFVKADLTNALQQAEGNSLADLSTRNPAPDNPITTQSGQTMTWETYLNRASGVLFGTKQKSKNPHRRADALKKLISIAQQCSIND